VLPEKIKRYRRGAEVGCEFGRMSLMQRDFSGERHSDRLGGRCIDLLGAGQRFTSD